LIAIGSSPASGTHVTQRPRKAKVAVAFPGQCAVAILTSSRTDGMAKGGITNEDVEAGIVGQNAGRNRLVGLAIDDSFV